LGGGFSRYSVDREWLVPHFEKMLYDQALVGRAYLHAWQITGDQRWRQVLDEIVAYVLRDLRLPGGGIASAEDADSEGEEGLFYTWLQSDIEATLGPDLAPAALAWWGVQAEGNFEGRSILFRPTRGDLLRPVPVEEARRRLFEARSGRVRPGRDDKTLTEWNAMMCATLAEAALATGEPSWREAAEALGALLLERCRRVGDGRVLRCPPRGEERHSSVDQQRHPLAQLQGTAQKRIGRASATVRRSSDRQLYRSPRLALCRERVDRTLDARGIRPAFIGVLQDLARRGYLRVELYAGGWNRRLLYVACVLPPRRRDRRHRAHQQRE